MPKNTIPAGIRGLCPNKIASRSSNNLLVLEIIGIRCLIGSQTRRPRNFDDFLNYWSYRTNLLVLYNDQLASIVVPAASENWLLVMTSIPSEWLTTWRRVPFAGRLTVLSNGKIGRDFPSTSQTNHQSTQSVVLRNGPELISNCYFLSFIHAKRMGAFFFRSALRISRVFREEEGIPISLARWRLLCVFFSSFVQLIGAFYYSGRISGEWRNF